MHLEAENRACNAGIGVWCSASRYSPCGKVLSGSVRNLTETVLRWRAFSRSFFGPTEWVGGFGWGRLRLGLVSGLEHGRGSVWANSGQGTGLAPRTSVGAACRLKRLEDALRPRGEWVGAGGGAKELPGWMMSRRTPLSGGLTGPLICSLNRPDHRLVWLHCKTPDTQDITYEPGRYENAQLPRLNRGAEVLDFSVIDRQLVELS